MHDVKELEKFADPTAKQKTLGFAARLGSILGSRRLRGERSASRYSGRSSDQNKRFVHTNTAIATNVLCSAAVLFWSNHTFSEEERNEEPSAEAAAGFEHVVVARKALDQELGANQEHLTDRELASMRIRLSAKAEEVVRAADAFLADFPSSKLSLQARQQGIYAAVMTGMLQRKHAPMLGNLVESISSCLFETDAPKQFAISAKQAADVQPAVEASFAAGATDAIRFGPESYNGVFQFLRRARTDAGKKLARALLESPDADVILKDCARAVLNRKYSVGQALPFEFDALDGREVSLSAMRGKVVLVDFWATSCTPCVAELPRLMSLSEKYRDKGFEIVAISTDDDSALVGRFAKENALPWPTQCDGKGFKTQFAVECGVTAVPCYWLVDRSGVVREMDARSDLEEKISMLCSESR